MYRPISSKLNPVLNEEQILNFWKLHRIFAKASAIHQGSSEFVFYEAPQNASRKPDLNAAFARSVKDVFPRYKLMRGYHVTRRGGWDTHGLPVEIGIEKRLGFTSKSQIEDYGIDRFNALCRKSAFEFIKDWEHFSDRLAFWVDMQDAYVSYTNEYIESVWWTLKTFWDRGLLYQGYKVVPYCPRCGTPVSDHEMALGTSEAVDPSIFVRLPLADEPGTSLLVWTTSPWTLPGNVAVAAQPDLEYVTVRRGLPEGGSEKLILAHALVEKVFGDQPVSIVDSFKGKKLKGRRYHPLFTFLHPGKPAYFIIMQDTVTVEAGTGLAQIAPAFGAEDLQAAIEHDLPVLMTVSDDGTFIPEVRPWRGQFVKDAEPLIIDDLQVRGLLFHAGSIRHAYPFCCHCDTPLLSFARNTWYVRTSQSKERLVNLNQQITWIPASIKNGLFGSLLEDNLDWIVGRERFWGTPLPVWECEACHHQLVVGSLAELSQLTGRDQKNLDLHRPDIDQVRLPCPNCRKEMKRVPEVADVWFDSGSMPVAQWHFPYENRPTFRAHFPADLICETVDQTLGWFYSLHAISALLFDSIAYKNVICLGPVLDASGQKISKPRSSLVDPWEVLNTYGADALRWYLYTASPPGEARSFSMDLVGEVFHNFILTLWNVYAFFITHANLDHWTPNTSPSESENLGKGVSLDRWLISELNSLVRDVTQAYESCDVTGAARSIQSFVEDLSSWYLRHSRRRFWDDAPDADKASAYSALHTTLLTISHLLAPAMPFLAETLYQNLVRSNGSKAPESVHLSNWPGFDPDRIDDALNNEMRLVRKLAAFGQAARSQAGIKARQPLSEIAFAPGEKAAGAAIEHHADLLADELNVKRVRLIVAGQELMIQPGEMEAQLEEKPGQVVVSEGACLAVLTTALTPALIREGLGREVIHRVQELRKQADLAIADRIELYISATPELWEAIQEHREAIQGETLTAAIHRAEPPEGAMAAEVWFDGQWLKASFTRLGDQTAEFFP